MMEMVLMKSNAMTCSGRDTRMSRGDGGGGGD